MFLKMATPSVVWRTSSKTATSRHLPRLLCSCLINRCQLHSHTRLKGFCFTISSNFHSCPKVFARKEKKRKEWLPEELEEHLAKKEEGKRRSNEYKAAVKTIVDTFREELRLEEERKRDIDGAQVLAEKAEREQQAMNLAAVSQSNEELKQKREERLQKQREMDQMLLEQKLEEERKKERKLFEERRKIVSRAIEESKDFVTLENLEEKIAYALENEVNYNFALTPEGKKIHSTKPPGNFDGSGWQGPGPAAFKATGVGPPSGEWDWVFNRKHQVEDESKTVASLN